VVPLASRDETREGQKAKVGSRKKSHVVRVKKVCEEEVFGDVLFLLVILKLYTFFPPNNPWIHIRNELSGFCEWYT
jgi:hypothetical protein